MIGLIVGGSLLLLIVIGVVLLLIVRRSQMLRYSSEMPSEPIPAVTHFHEVSDFRTWTNALATGEWTSDAIQFVDHGEDEGAL
jgi:hypothetical protein